MTFARTDDLDGNQNIRVRYILTDPNFSFEIQATKLGVVITGTTPAYTDWVPIQEVLSWAQYQAQRLRERGTSISQFLLDRGEIG